MRNKTLLFLMILATSVYSCYSDKEDLLYGDEICDVETISFADDILPIIRNHCATVGCHVQGGSGNGIFENYNQIKAKVDKGALRTRVLELRDMPPSGPLDDCSLLHIKKWIENGAPDN